MSTLKRIRALHVIPFLDMGGAARMAIDLVRYLRDNEGVDARLCVLGSAQSFFSLSALTEPPVFLGFSGRYRHPFETGRCLRRLRALTRDFQPAIVHSHLWIADQLCALAVARQPIHHVAHIVDTRPWLASPRLASRLRRRLYQTTLRHATFIAASTRTQEYTCEHLSIPRENMPVLFNGIDLGDFPLIARSDDGGPAVIGAAGRFDPEKGHEFLIRACGELAKQGCLFRLRIAGSGSLEPSYIRIAGELGIPDRLELPGKVKDIAGFYRGLDIFVMPSLYAEGLPLALLGAMATERPVVATTGTAGAEDVIRDGVDGRLVPAGDPHALAAVLEPLVRDPAARRALGGRARARVQEAFTVQRLAHEVAARYAKIAPAG